MWHEGIANRGGNEIASCLYAHLQTMPSTIENITLYSDSCFGQNKNSYVALMFSIFASTNKNITTIDHKFLVPGHTHMECDIDHSIIERKKRKTTVQIHHPRDWYQFIKTVGVKTPFRVHEMEQSTFLNFGHVAKTKSTFRKVNEANERVNWHDIKWLRYTNDSGIILYKNTLEIDEPFKVINIRKRGIGQLKFKDVPQCYSEPIKISDAKKKDLISLLPLIDNHYHDFYKELRSESLPDFHPDLTEADIDD